MPAGMWKGPVVQAKTLFLSLVFRRERKIDLLKKRKDDGISVKENDVKLIWKFDINASIRDVIIYFK
jgi:hypothetical protein